MARRDVDLQITRRDFVNATLAGSGAALLAARAPAHAVDAQAVDAWAGYGGVGDYRHANGNTEDVTTSAHRIRDGNYDGRLAEVEETGEAYDLVVVGAGFCGLATAHAFSLKRPQGACLVLDNQAIFGGYGKQNEFDVDGVRIAGPQASMNFILPGGPAERANGYWDALGLPERFDFAKLEGGDPATVFQTSTSASLYHGEQAASTGYWFGAGKGDGGGGWVKDIWDGDLARAPWPEATKRDLRTLRDSRPQLTDPAQAAYLDGITFADYATRVRGVSPDVLSYTTLGMCITGPQISALAAKSLPGMQRFPAGSPGAALGERFMSFPGGNTVIAKHFVKALWPDAIGGPATFAGIADGPVRLAALDRPGARRRLRLGALAVRVEHEGDPARAERVSVTYAKDGRLHRVRARAVVMGIGAWVGKHVVAGLPAERREALDRFLYAPVLIVNVALRNWRFLDRLGISTARWFDGGFGFYAAIRRPMRVGGRAAPFHPDKPIVMTIYAPIQTPGLPLEVQGPAARARLYATSYADYERQVLDQMTAMFGPAGFDARRDVAGIVLNRWGHAFVTPPPGFFFGVGGKPAPLKVATEPFGRIAFGQTGLEDWLGAAHAGARAFDQVAAAV